MKKRILSVLITLVMLIGILVGMLSVTALAAETTYKVHVGGVQVTDANKDDLTAAIIAAGGNATGKAAFDPTTSTLTLEDFTYEGGGSQYGTNTQFAAIWYELDELKIELKGNNIINAKGNDSAVS